MNHEASQRPQAERRGWGQAADVLGPRQAPEPQDAPAEDHRAAPRSLSVLIVDDCPIVRERLVRMIAEIRNVGVIGEAEDGCKARALFLQQRPDAVILDVQTPRITGLDLIVQFKRAAPECFVMVLTTGAAPEVGRRCVALGADHCFDTSKEFERIKERLRRFHPRRRQEHAVGFWSEVKGL